MKEHVLLCQSSCKRERCHAHPILDSRSSTQLVSGVKHIHIILDDQHVKDRIPIEVDIVRIGPVRQNSVTLQNLNYNRITITICNYIL